MGHFLVSTYKTGEFHFIENRPTEDFDRLFVDFTMGPPDLTTSLIIQDKSILPSLSMTKRASYSVNKTEMENIFYYVADSFMEQEWGLYSNGKQYAIATLGAHDKVESPFDNTIYSMHSHSDTPPDDRSEIESMGYWFYYENLAFNENGKLINKSSPWFEANLLPNDLHNLRESGISSYVYFPKSGNVYKMNKSTLPTIVKNRQK